jgi:adenylate cyclase
VLPGTRPSAALAVLPFVNVSVDREFDHFAEAFTRELTGTIRRLPGVRVAARASAATLAGRSREPGVIAEMLRVHAILDGRARRSSRQLAIDAELVSTRDGARLWAAHFTRPGGEAIAVQAEIAAAVARELQVPLLPGVAGRPPHPEAYDLYLRGRGIPGIGRTALERSVECFERALALDPEFGAAHAALAGAVVACGVYGYQPCTGLAPRVRAAAARALDLGAAEAEPRLALAMLALLVDWDFDAAAQQLHQVAEADPDEPDAQRWQAWLHAVQGRGAEAIAAGRRAVALDPLSATAHGTLALVHVWLRQPAEAIAAGEQAIAADPNSFGAHRALAAAHVVAGNADAARPELDQAVLLSRRHQWCVAELAIVCQALGDRPAAEALHDELAGRSPDEYVQRCVLAQTSGALGHLEDAFKLLDQAARLREPLPLVRLSPYFDSLRDHPRFRAIVR